MQWPIIILLCYQEIISACPVCKSALEKSSSDESRGGSGGTKSAGADKEKKIRELELELAQTKLALVQIECRSQEMSHELTSKNTELQVTP